MLVHIRWIYYYIMLYCVIAVVVDVVVVASIMVSSLLVLYCISSYKSELHSSILVKIYQISRET